MLITSRQWFLFTAILSLAILIAAFLFEWIGGYEACPLCILQRIALLAYTITAFILVIHSPNKWGIRFYSILLLSFSSLGAIIATRQVILQQSSFDQTVSCIPNLSTLLKVLPLDEAIKMLLANSTSCAIVDWRFLGLGFAQWAICLFIVLMLITLSQLITPTVTSSKQS